MLAEVSRQFIRACETHEQLVLVVSVIVAVLLRCVIAPFPYSGEGTPPMYGDYEAQRHWMEITTALPVREWYENSTRNDLLYWGLDYPPLTAYHSIAIGAIGHRLVPECFHLHTSRGHESVQCRLFMRASVVASDLLVYLPGAWWAVTGLSAAAPCDKKQNIAATRLSSIISLWWFPPLLLIDHGHFQYNGVCFGLCLASVGCLARYQIAAASVFFTSALLYKQIALYYAPAFFFAILAHCIHKADGVVSAIFRILTTGGVVLTTTAAIFLPWLTSPTPLASVGQVVHRMFPFARGLYEDKVANVWCSISVVIKLNKLLPPKLVPAACALATLVALLPTCVCCLRVCRNPGAAFVASLISSSLSFFLFAFQVHEKSILFPCVAMCLLPIAVGHSARPRWMVALPYHFALASMFSMYPLIVKDKLQVVYTVLCIALVCLIELTTASRLQRWLHRCCCIIAIGLHLIHGLVRAPSRYPDAWTLLITASSCGYFVLTLLGVTVMQANRSFDIAYANGGLRESQDLNDLKRD